MKTIPTECVQCPSNCGLYTCHPIGVYVNAGGSITCITSNGTEMDTGKPSGRGVKIVMSFECECGTRFDTTYQFNKGMTWVSTEVVSTGHVEPIETIWRD